MEEKHHSHSVSKLGYHIIWRPKFRHPVLVDAVAVETKTILAQTCAHYDWKLHEIEVMPDHIHIFVQGSPKDSPSDIAKTLKSISAVHIFNTFPKLKGRKFWGSGLWSPSTYYGSVGHISEETVRRYIQTQKERE